MRSDDKAYLTFPHHSLDAYGVAMEALVKADEIAKRLPRGYGPLSDQLRRAGAAAPVRPGGGVRGGCVRGGARAAGAGDRGGGGGADGVAWAAGGDGDAVGAVRLGATRLAAPRDLIFPQEPLPCVSGW